MNDNVTSLSLLERLREPADHEAWRRFYDIYGPLIRLWLLRRGIAPQDADDLQQEVMQCAATELADFRHNGNPGALRCWLRRVVANRLREFWRKHNRAEAVPGGSAFAGMAEQLADPDSELSRIWNEEYYRAICDRLLEVVTDEFQPQTMAAFRRVAIEGRKPSEVAEVLGLTANAVRIAQSRVLRRLRS